MAKKTEYSFQPDRDLTLSEVTLLLGKITRDWLMDQERYDALPEDLKDVFKPVKEGK